MKTYDHLTVTQHKAVEQRIKRAPAAKAARAALKAAIARSQALGLAARKAAQAQA